LVRIRPAPSLLLQTSLIPPLDSRSIEETPTFSARQRTTMTPSSRLRCTTRLTAVRFQAWMAVRRHRSLPPDRGGGPERRNGRPAQSWMCCPRLSAPAMRAVGTRWLDRAGLAHRLDYRERFRPYWGSPSNTLHAGKRERRCVSQPRNAYVKELMRDLSPLPAIVLRSERYPSRALRARRHMPPGRRSAAIAGCDAVRADARTEPGV